MRLHPIALTVMTLMLAACGGDKSSSGGTTGGGTTTPVATPRDIIVSPALGFVKNVNITVSRLDGTAIGAPLSTTDQGKVTVTVPAGVEAVIITATGGAGAQYFEESANRYEDMPAGSTMHAIALVSHNKQTIAVTPLTELAYRLAQGTMGGVHKFSILQANDYIEAYFDIDNILTPPHRIDELTDYRGLSIATMTEKNAAKYALFLSALSQYASTRTGSSTQASLKFMDEMAQDLGDDGLINKVPATAYDAGNLANNLKSALVAFKTNVLDANGIAFPRNDLIPALDFESYYNGFIFKIGGKINALDFETDPGPGVDTVGFAFPRFFINVAADRLAGLTGTYPGKNLDNKDCSVIVAGDGTVSIVEKGVTVSTEKFDGGNEDVLRQTLNAAKVVTQQYFQAKPSIDSTKAVFLGFGAGNALQVAGETGEDKVTDSESTTKVLRFACYISS